MDLGEIAKKIEERASGLSLRDALFFFAGMERSPDPKKLREDAVQSIQQFPLSSLMGASYHNRRGAVVHRTEGGGFADNNDSAIRQKIDQAETIRRQVHAQGQVEALRRHLTERYYLARDTFHALLQHSPFVAPEQLETYCRGFTRFFEGDFVSALYILTPLLENSLRHVLRESGHDVSKFDDSDQTQEDRAISSLFEQMRPTLDEVFGDRLTTDIDNVFLSHPGPRLRHAVAHGLLCDGDPFSPDAAYACWLMFHLCLLPLAPHRKELEVPE